MDQQGIKLSNNILINCPERGFMLRQARHCFTCEHYQGVARATERGEPLPTDYHIICGRPITRKMVEIAED